MTDADETVDDSEILSVDALNFPLNNAAARDLGFADLADSPATGVIGEIPSLSSPDPWTALELASP
jgi:hypothetical protein